MEYFFRRYLLADAVIAQEERSGPELEFLRWRMWRRRQRFALGRFRITSQTNTGINEKQRLAGSDDISWQDPPPATGDTNY